MQFYRNLGVYYPVDGMKPIQEVTKDILDIVNSVGATCDNGPSRN